jgi:FkbM family methyltransferase
MTWIENAIYWLQFGPLRRGFRFFARRFLGRGNRILLGHARGCIFAGADLPYRLGIYEIHVQHALARVLKRGAVFYDLGANVGFYSLLGSKLVGDGGVVIAFEPSADNGLALRSLCAANGVRNVQLISEAVTAVDGEARFAVGTNHAQNHLANGQQAGSLKVRTLTLDRFTKIHPAPQVVLMDIEGAEFDALRGARNMLSLPNAPAWIIEVHNPDTDSQITELFATSGYGLTTLLPPVLRAGRYPIHLLAEKPPVRVG